MATKSPKTHKANKRATEAKRIPHSLEGLKGFGHGVRWDGLRHYYKRKRRTKQEIEEDSRTSVSAEDPCEIIGSPPSIVGGHPEARDSTSEAALDTDILGQDTSLQLSTNTNFVVPSTYIPVPTEMFDLLMFPSGVAFASMDYSSYLEEPMQHNGVDDSNPLSVYASASQEQEREVLFNYSHNCSSRFGNMTFPAVCECQVTTSSSGFTEYSSPYGNSMADGTTVSVSMANGHIGYEYTLARHVQADTPYIPMESATPRAFVTNDNFLWRDIIP